MKGPRYAELQVTSHFSFLRGASSCEELFAAAAIMRIEALAVSQLVGGRRASPRGRQSHGRAVGGRLPA